MSNQAATANNNAAQQPTGEPKEEKKKEIVLVHIKKDEFDLEAYAANYSGHTKINRLLFIAEHCKELELDACKMVVDELKKTTNSQLYKSVTEKVGDKLGPSYQTDQAWIDATDKKAAQLQERLDMELNGFKTNLMKDSIRVRVAISF